jgi:hypothetical protein
VLLNDLCCLSQIEIQIFIIITSAITALVQGINGRVQEDQPIVGVVVVVHADQDYQVFK